MPVTYDYARPQTTVDVLLFTVRDFWTDNKGDRPRLDIALIERDREPFMGRLALPGTVMRVEREDDGKLDATDLDAAKRVLREKLRVRPPHLEQLYTWFTRDADPRGPTTVITYFAVVPFDHFRQSSPVVFKPVDELPKLAFNHNQMVAKGVERVRGKAGYSTLPALLMPECFTMPELQAMYEAVLDRKFDASDFRRRIEKLDILDIVSPDTAEGDEVRQRTTGDAGGRPGRIYRLKKRELTKFDRTAFTEEARPRSR